MGKITIKDLAMELGVPELTVRKAARELFGRAQNRKWRFTKPQANKLIKFVKASKQLPAIPHNVSEEALKQLRNNADMN